MRLFGGGVLLRMDRPHRQPAKAQPAQQVSHRALRQDHAEAPLDPLRQIDPAPAHHPILRQIGALADPLRHLGLLRRGQTRRRPRRAPIRQPRQALLVVTMHPVPKRLAVHPASLRRLRARPALPHQSQGQHPPRRRRVLAPRRRPTKTRCVQVQPRDQNRHPDPPTKSVRKKGITLSPARESPNGSQTPRPLV